MPERSMPGRSLLVRPPGPLRPHAVIQSAWADLFAHVLSDADRADYVALLQRRRDADGPAARKAARELEREAREAGAVADAALLALEALRGQRLALYKLDANGSGFVAAEACASVCAASGGRGFVRVCDAIAALEAATRPETKEARLAEPKCGGAARRAFYALDARGEGHVRADALLAEWRAARPPVEFYEAVRAAPRDGAALRLRDFEAALETAFALARHRRLRAPATAALRAAAGALFLDQHRAQRSGDGPLEFRDQIATDARARRDRVRREAIVPLDDDEAAVIPARHVVPHAPTRVCLDVAPLREMRKGAPLSSTRPQQARGGCAT
ncbi:hypothetical protein M885DRAFT_513143 [Pelagophyceae sp. CCMP2097]|nr:hypothetical protein M885DRAFT_513143 [Pelagophyceae sp. CCMP2097]